MQYDESMAGSAEEGNSRCARPSTKAPIDSLMTKTVAMDIMTAQTMTATVSSRVRPTGNCMQSSTGSVSSLSSQVQTQTA